jgi:hypothetical protein
MVTLLGRVTRPRQLFQRPQGQGVAPGSQTGVIRGRVVIVSGPTGAVVGVFVYAAGTTPALGNPPIVAITNQTLDPFGNSVQPADSLATSAEFIVLGAAGSYFQVAAQSGLASALLGTGDGSETSPGILDATVIGSGSSRQLATEIQSPNFGGNPAAIQIICESDDSTVNSQINLNCINRTVFGISGDAWWADGTGQMNLPSAGGPFIFGETYHDVSGGSGNMARVKLLPWNMVSIDVQASWAATGTTTMASLPSASYYPTQTRQFAVASNAAVAQNARVFIPTSGATQLVVSGGASNGQGGASVTYPTN